MYCLLRGRALIWLISWAAVAQTRLETQPQRDRLFIQQTWSDNSEAGRVKLKTVLHNGSTKPITAFVLRIQLFDFYWETWPNGLRNETAREFARSADLAAWGSH